MIDLCDNNMLNELFLVWKNCWRERESINILIYREEGSGITCCAFAQVLWSHITKLHNGPNISTVSALWVQTVFMMKKWWNMLKWNYFKKENKNISRNRKWKRNCQSFITFLSILFSFDITAVFYNKSRLVNFSNHFTQISLLFLAYIIRNVLMFSVLIFDGWVQVNLQPTPYLG